MIDKTIKVVVLSLVLGGHSGVVCAAKEKAVSDDLWNRTHRVFAYNAPHRARYPSLARNQQGRLVLLFTQASKEQEDAGLGDVMMIQSTDQGETWSSPTMIYEGKLGEPRTLGTLTTLASGNLVAAVAEINKEEKLQQVHLLTSRDGGRNWKQSAPLKFPGVKWASPYGRLIEEKDGTLLMAMETEAIQPMGEGAQTVSGKIGGANEFYGADYVDIGDKDAWDFGTGNYTIELWFKADEPSGNAALIDFYGGNTNPTANRMAIKVAASGVQAGFDIYQSEAWRIETGDIGLTTGNWYHLVLVRKGDDLFLYKNAMPVGKASGRRADKIQFAGGPAYIGSWGAGPNNMDSQIDELRISHKERALQWIKTSFESERDQLFTFGKEEERKRQGNWLPGWDKRIRLTIDSGKIDDDLADFPLLVHLSSSSGMNKGNATTVFRELKTNANRKKIAVTEANGTSQYYVEIEKWDGAKKEAWLWAKAPRISSSKDTELYLYYDKDQKDNTTYVGDVNSPAGRKVWDSAYKAVWHLGETDPLDSTSSNNHGKRRSGKGVRTVVGLLRSTDGGNTWGELSPIASNPEKSFSQPAVLATGKKSLVAIFNSSERLYCSRSRDDGYHWSNPEPVLIGREPYLVRISDDALACVAAMRPSNYGTMWVAFSYDNAESWRCERTVMGYRAAAAHWGWPAALALDDDHLLIAIGRTQVYTALL